MKQDCVNCVRTVLKSTCHAVSAWVLAVLWEKTLMTFYGINIFYGRPRAQFNVVNSGF